MTGHRAAAGAAVLLAGVLSMPAAMAEQAASALDPAAAIALG